ncbi:MAG: hypothetical protein KC635_29320, partial [Myxococcales bacterium]|nr:hypothetical protein [Myxococcales bacterium]
MRGPLGSVAIATIGLAVSVSSGCTDRLEMDQAATPRETTLADAPAPLSPGTPTATTTTGAPGTVAQVPTGASDDGVALDVVTTVVRGMAQDVVAGDVLVRFLPTADATERDAVAARAGGYLDHESESAGLTLLRVDRDADLDEVLALLAEEPAVASADVNHVFYGATTSPDQAPLFNYQWYLQRSNASAAWWATASTLGSGVVVAVVDSGVTPTPSLPASAIVPGY